jgi:hypothetical protein
MASDILQLPQVVLSERGIVLHDWLLIGPFNAAVESDAIGIDFISERKNEYHGGTENNLSHLIMHGFDGDQPPSLEKLGTMAVVDFTQTYRALPDTGPKSVAYAAVCVSVTNDRTACLMLASDEGAKVWLNEEPVFTSREGRDTYSYNDSIRLHLKRGNNLLLIKEVHFEKKFGFAARLEPDLESAARTAIEIDGAFLKRVILPTNEGLVLFAKAMPQQFAVSVKIRKADEKEEKVAQLESNVPVQIPYLGPGLYLCKAMVKDWSFEQPFYVGNILALSEKMQALRSGIANNDQTTINVDALLRRLEISVAPPKFDFAISDWDRLQILGDRDYKALYAATELQDILNRVQQGEEAFRNRPGLHIRAFRSKIDDQVMHYRLFVPSSYRPDGPRLPLVIVMHPVFSVPRPFLEGVEMGQQKQAELWTRTAENLGVGLLWVGYRVCPYGNPIEFTYLDEVLAAVEHDYNVDPTRISLYGICSAGLTAAMEALRNPNRYAAIAFYNPVLHRLKNRFDDSGEYASQPAYRDWLRKTDPLSDLAKVKDLPIWIIHDDVDPDHGPLSHSVDFVEEARALGNSPRFSRLKSTPVTWFSCTTEAQMIWLSKLRRANAELRSRSARNNTGPLSRVFAERFIVVEATGGDESDRKANAALAQAFQDAWRRTNCGSSCRMVLDTELVPNEEQTSNLVLLGNEHTNSVWKRFVGHLPLSMDASRLTINGQVWDGRVLGVQAWFPHPTIPGRKIAVIGGPSAGATVFGTLDLCVDGWFDYAVWDIVNGKPYLAIAGDFEEKTNPKGAK